MTSLAGVLKPCLLTTHFCYHGQSSISSRTFFLVSLPLCCPPTLSLQLVLASSALGKMSSELRLICLSRQFQVKKLHPNIHGAKDTKAPHARDLCVAVLTCITQFETSKAGPRQTANLTAVITLYISFLNLSSSFSDFS